MLQKEIQIQIGRHEDSQQHDRKIKTNKDIENKNVQQTVIKFSKAV